MSQNFLILPSQKISQVAKCPNTPKLYNTGFIADISLHCSDAMLLVSRLLKPFCFDQIWAIHSKTFHRFSGEAILIIFQPTHITGLEFAVWLTQLNFLRLNILARAEDEIYWLIYYTFNPDKWAGKNLSISMFRWVECHPKLKKLLMIRVLRLIVGFS